MTIAINGSNGFIGRYLSDFLSSKGHEIVILKREIYGDIKELQNSLNNCDCVINLAGANISNRWSEKYKKILRSSRIDTTKNLVEAMIRMQNPPLFFISTSAIGIYESGQIHDESSIKFDNGFLGELAKDWESEAIRATEFGVKTAVFRFGVVLGDGGALAKMTPIFRLGLGGVLGDGRQDFSWIHIEDLARAYEFVLSNQIVGIYNLVSPNTVTNAQFTEALAKTLNRMAIFKVPNFMLKLRFGEGSQILLKGQRVYPRRLLEAGLIFKFNQINSALENLLKPS